MKSTFSTGKIVFILVIGLMILGVAALIIFRPERPEIQPPAEARVAVTVLEVAAERVEDVILLPGRTEPREDVTVAAEQAGRILAIHAREGDAVNAGDPLLRIDDGLWATAERSAELREADARRDGLRAEELHAQGAIPLRDLEAARTAAESAAIALEEIRIQRSRCVPVSPLAGRVETRHVAEGEYVHPGQPVLRILDTRTVKVRFDLPERDVRALKPGDTCVIRFDSLPDSVYTGVVAVVSAAAHPANNAFDVEAHLDNASGEIRAGMIARVGVRRGVIQDAVLLPVFAVVPMEGEHVSYVVEDDRAVRRIVRIGGMMDSRVRIRSGIEPGDRVILDGNRHVLDGTPVRVVPAWTPEPTPAVPKSK